MRARWKEVLEEADPGGLDAAAKCEQWQAALEEMKAKYDRLIVEGRWISGPGDLLGVLGRARRELDHCRILGWLMDPAGAHGFRDSFLKEIFGQAYPAEEYAGGELLSMNIRLEVSRPNSRADIVASNRRLSLVFEVKVDAYEQENQCSRLVADWARDPDPHFVFLTPDGKNPSTATDEFTTLSFSQVKGILRLLLHEQRESAASAGWRTAIAYLDTLDAEFS